MRGDQHTQMASNSGSAKAPHLQPLSPQGGRAVFKLLIEKDLQDLPLPLGEVEPKRGRGKTGCDYNMKFQHCFYTGPPPRCARPLPLRGQGWLDT
ncbi:hypothetical protein Poly41_10310 [Novipirellula artificiosorum]|uniref:Uncharacterized protein n=1 Tax=Novipirellula artificiosorum TaxID=2528016 RepID=A0A5C6E566_9BACT|nr:hypothetical protein Poly41_10310 [Novipirellula artificiosorum]